MASIHDLSKPKNPKDGNSQSDPSAGVSIDPSTLGGIPIASIGGFGSFPPTDQGSNYDPEEKPDELIDLTEKAKNGELSMALHRDEETVALIEALSRKKKSNALLVGDPGVGKTQLAENLALLLVNGDPLANDLIGDKVIYELPLSNLVAGKGIVGELEQAITRIIEYVRKTECILFIDEIHQIAGGDKQTYGKIAQQLKPALSRSDMRVIGATTTSEATQFMKDPALKRRFTSINIPELTFEQTADVLDSVIPAYEKYHNVIIPDANKDKIINTVILESENYKQADNHRPDTALTLLDTAMAKAKARLSQTPALQGVTTNRLLTITDIKKAAIAQFQQTIVGPSEVQAIEDNLANNIIGQDAVKDDVIKLVKRLSLNLFKQKKPNVFMFAGPTGTGKSQIAKEMAQALFGRRDALITLNMSEFSNESTLQRITGSVQGYIGSDDNNTLPLDSLNNNPFQIVLLDEFEKAATNVKRFFMQAFDEGKVTLNRKNTVIDCSRAIFIITSNAGAKEFNNKAIGFGATSQKSNKEISEILSQQFDPELLGRISHKLIFESISKDEYRKIMAIKYNQAISEALELHPEYTLSPLSIDKSDDLQLDLLNDLVDHSYNPNENGRPAEKVIREYIEDKIIENYNNTQFNLF